MATRRIGWISAIPAVITAAWGLADPASAMPARPGAIAVQQPDGTQITVRLRGDEYAHWYEDVDGRVVTRARATGQWVYAVDTNGTIEASDLVVGRDAGPAEKMRQETASRVRAIAQARREARLAVSRAADRTPTSGTIKQLVILVNFSNQTISGTRQDYDDLLNGAGYCVDGAVGSFKDYYLEVSYDQLTIESTVVEPVTLAQTHQYYGENDEDGEDLRPTEMVVDAIAALDACGFDFGQMDGDGDGYVDSLTIIHAGRGEEDSADPNYVWSHQWELDSPVMFDGVRLSRYTTVPAVRDAGGGLIRIGVLCHETGHLLGLPDLYDRDYGSLGVGVFCLMGSGGWNGRDGRCPAHLCAWSKVRLGWVSPTAITQSKTYSIGQVETNATIYKLQGSWPFNEYFLIENRQGVGFDAGLPGPNRGILIWHVDDNQADNDDETHYLVSLEEPGAVQHLAGNLNDGEDSDYYRQGNATQFSDESIPNSSSYTNAPLGWAISNVGVTAPTMSFQVGTHQAGDLKAEVYLDRQKVAPGTNVLVLAHVSGGLRPYTYKWNTGNTRISFIVIAQLTATYSVAVTDATGKSVEASATLNVAASALTVSVLADPNGVQPGASSTLTATVSGGVAPYTYLWSTGDTEDTIIVSPTERTTYSVTVTDESGLSATGSVVVYTTVVAGATNTSGGAPCLAPMAPIGFLLVLLMGCMASNARRSTRRRRT